MEVKPGHKQTEVGVIPQSWTVVELQQLCGEAITYGIVQCGPHIDNGVPYIRVSDMAARELDVAGMLRTSHTIAARFARSTVREGDIVYALRGKLGEVRRVGKAVVGANLTQGTARLSPKPTVNSIYLLWAMRCRRSLREAELQAKGTTFREIALGDLRRIRVPLPSPAEQEVIAVALSDADALIESLEQLLVKKRGLKHGATQELLTAKMRLPGFSGEWEVKRLGDIGDIAGAGVDKKIRAGEMPVRLANYLDVYRRTFLYSKDLTHEVTAKPEQARRCTIQKGDVFFTPTSEVPDDIGHSAVAMEDIPDGAYSYHVVRLRLKEHWDLRFRAYAFSTASFYAMASTLCEGSGTRYVITLPKFRAMAVLVPPTVEEQAAIATVLSDMDSEIAALEAKLAKARHLKEGMMQELLTGRIRLPVERVEGDSIDLVQAT